jgi:hypothetical protein
MTRSISQIIKDLGAALDELLGTVRREFPEDARAVELVLERCRRAGSTVGADAIDARELAGQASGLVADRPGGLGEAIIARDNHEERYRLNEELDALRLRVKRLAAELDEAAGR